MKKEKLYSASQIADYYIEKSLKEGISDLTPIKLQKLIYFAYGWYFAIYKKPLLNEMIQAWSYGPVIRSLYHQTKHFGNSPITKRISNDSLDFNDNITKLLDVVWDSYKEYSGMQLSNSTHKDGTPWKKIYDEEVSKYGQLRNYVDIPDEQIKEYFQGQLESNESTN